MNKKVYLIIGWILMVIGILLPIAMVVEQATQIIQKNLNSMKDLFVEGFFPGAIIFILVFLPGLNFYYISKKEESNGLEKWAVGLTITPLVLEILLVLWVVINSPYHLPEGLLFCMFIGIFLLIPYGVGVLLLAINYFKQMGKRSKA